MHVSEKSLLKLMSRTRYDNDNDYDAPFAHPRKGIPQMNMGGGAEKGHKWNDVYRPSSTPDYMKMLPPTPNVEPSPCAAEYMRSLADPCMSMPSCIPNGIPTNSLKAQTFAKGTFSGSSADNTASPLSYNGTAFVTLKPYLGQIADQHDSFGAPVLSSFSGGSSTGTEGTTLNNVSSGSTLQSNYTNSSFTEAQLSAASFNWRLVSACIRARFMGSTMHDSGRMIGLVEPDHADLTGLTASQLEAYDEATKVEFRDVGNQWFEVKYNGPTTAQEFQWLGDETAGTFANIGNAFMAVAVTNCESGVAGVPFSGEWEVYCNYEYIGAIVRGKTISFADPAGFSAAISVASNFSKIQKETANDKNPNKSFMAKAWAGFKKALAMSTPIVDGVKRSLGTIGQAVATENPELLLKLIPDIQRTISEVRKIQGPSKKQKKRAAAAKKVVVLAPVQKKKIVVRPAANSARRTG
jgi:hypothetical protein